MRKNERQIRALLTEKAARFGGFLFYKGKFRESVSKRDRNRCLDRWLSVHGMCR